MFVAIHSASNQGYAPVGHTSGLRLRITPVSDLRGAQPLRDILPDRVADIQSDCIGSLDFHGSLAAAAGHAQYVTLNFRKTSLPHPGPGRAGTRVFEYRFPVFGRERRI